MLKGELILETGVDPVSIDVNGHMNVAWYLHVFDAGVDALWQKLGIDEGYRREHGGTTFAVESHLRFVAEIRASDQLQLSTQIIGCDKKRIHQFQRLYTNGTQLAATCEWMNLHVDQATRRVSPWSEAVYSALRHRAEAHQQWTLPAAVGARIKMRTKGG